MNLQNLSQFEFVVYSVIFLNIVLSMMAFGNFRRLEQLKFNIGAILHDKQYYRIISSAFIHGDWMHLGFNMYVLYSFSINSLSYFVSIPLFLAIYFASLIIGNLLPLYINRNDSRYSALGASGAVSGVLYASIYFNPFGELYIYFFPMTNWLFAILYLVYTVWASKKANDNVGHEAHFGGALAGLFIAFLINPSIAYENWLIVLAMMAPILYFFLTMKNTSNILTQFKRWDNDETPNYSNRKIDDLYNYSKSKKEAELNTLLEKVKKTGVDSLSNYEKKRLDDLSQDLN